MRMSSEIRLTLHELLESTMVTNNWAARSGYGSNHQMWATQACQIGTTSLVYPFGISSTESTENFHSHVGSTKIDRPLKLIGLKPYREVRYSKLQA
jgi:hypothetical protein